MKLIVGLGNPGSRYQKTRHNIGQRFIDALKANMSDVKRTRSKIATRVGRDKMSNVKFHKTAIFMNKSGKEVKELLTINHKLLTRDLLVAHDDLDLDPGQWKLQFNRSSAGHKGVQSVIDELGTQEFWRLRIGVGKSPVGKTANQFVVEKPTVGERELIDKAIKESLPRVQEWVRGE